MENYTRQELRTWVQETVENIFKGEIKESIKSNVKITFEYDDEDGFWVSDICVRQLLNGKWELKIMKDGFTLIKTDLVMDKHK